jgi:hypothetical protein
MKEINKKKKNNECKTEKGRRQTEKKKEKSSWSDKEE